NLTRGHLLPPGRCYQTLRRASHSLSADTASAMLIRCSGWCDLQRRRYYWLSPALKVEAMIMPLADLVSSGGLLFAWTLATIILCLLGWLAFTLRQRQFGNDPDD